MIPAATEGRLVENIVHFTRALRKAGIKVGTAQTETAIEAVEAAGFSNRSDFYHVLRATLINRAEDLEIFHQVFSMFWRDPDFLQSMIHMLSPQLRDESPPAPKPAAHRRAADALGEAPERPKPPKEETEVIHEMRLTWSEIRVDKEKDFEQMSAREIREAEHAVRALTLPCPPLVTRRTHPAPKGPRPDPHATLRAAIRRGGEIREIQRRAPRARQPDLVAICDISGSMSVYSRMVLRFLHAAAHARVSDWGRVSAFTFGTGLTNISRALAAHDPDVALSQIGREARDWEGGTRIGTALERFNKDWSRRLLGRGAMVLLITDGLERGDPELLRKEAERLRLSSKRLVWLNPLLRWDGFAPKARGVQALMGAVDSLHGCHNLDSLADLVEALKGEGDLARVAAKAS